MYVIKDILYKGKDRAQSIKNKEVSIILFNYENRLQRGGD